MYVFVFALLLFAPSHTADALTLPSMNSNWIFDRLRPVLRPTPPPAPAPPPPSPTPPAPFPTPSPAPLPEYAQQVEQEVFRLINTERAKVGVPVLARDSRLEQIARAHSADMLANNYFAHEDASGCSTDCRLRNAGYAYRTYGENLFTTWGYELTPAAAAKMTVDNWMESTGHRQNMLNRSFTMAGVGIAKLGTRIYATAIFALPF